MNPEIVNSQQCLLLSVPSPQRSFGSVCFSQGAWPCWIQEPLGFLKWKWCRKGPWAMWHHVTRLFQMKECRFSGWILDWVEGCSGEIGKFSLLTTCHTSTNCHANTASCFMQDVWKPLWLRSLLGFFSHSQVAESMSSVFVYKPAKYFLLNTCACVEHTATVWSWFFSVKGPAPSPLASSSSMCPCLLRKSQINGSISSPTGSSRGPSPLTMGAQDTLPVAAAFTETVNAYFKGADPSK